MQREQHTAIGCPRVVFLGDEMPVKISISSYEGCMPARSSQPQTHIWIKLSRNASLPFFFPILLRNRAGSLSSKRFQPLAGSASRLAPIREAGTQCLVTFCRFPLVPLPLHCHEHHPCPPLSLHRMPFLLQAEDRTCQESEAGQPSKKFPYSTRKDPTTTPTTPGPTVFVGL